jgi:hypothetical protein
MGTNDHMPTTKQKTKHKVLGAAKERMSWSQAGAETLHHVISTISENGGYIGFGQNVDNTCLLLYVKAGAFNERIAIETREAILPTLAGLVEDIIG